jgi:DNA-binding GntR family transcriptional regulator
MGVQRAYDEIRNQILHLDLQPGQILDEAHFVGRLGISRTPVRQAFMQLQADGLVELLPNRGARVSPLDLTTVREFFELFEVTQRMATRWAALRRTDADLARIDAARQAFEAMVAQGDVRAMMETNLRFHDAIGSSCGNKLVGKQYAQLLTLALRLSRLALIYEPDEPMQTRSRHLAQIVREHRKMTDLISRRDADRAERMAGEHSKLFQRRVSEYLAHPLAQPVTVEGNGAPEPRKGAPRGSLDSGKEISR